MSGTIVIKAGFGVLIAGILIFIIVTLLKKGTKEINQSTVTRIILSVLITGLLTFFGMWYITTYANGTNPIQLKIAEIDNGDFFSNLLKNCLDFAMVGVAICCVNAILILPELIDEGTNVTTAIIFLALRAILAIIVCVIIAKNLTPNAEKVIGKILYILLSILLTVLSFAPTIAFLYRLVTCEDLIAGIVGFLVASLAVILLLALFLPAILILIVFVALKLLSYFASSGSSYSYGSSSSTDEEVEESTYINRNGMTTELIQVDAFTWRDTMGNYYKSDDGGNTFYEDD